MGNVKGTAVASVLKYMRENYGETTLTRVMAELDPEMSRVITRALPVSWVPAGYVRQLYQAANRVAGDGTSAFYRGIGAANAAHDLPNFFKAIMALATPEMVFGLFGMVWKMYYDTGQLHISKREKNFLAVEISGFADACDEFCEDLCGYCETLLTLDRKSVV